MNAIFSACGQFRYSLIEEHEHQCGIVMLNPSRAGTLQLDGSRMTDPTNNKIRRFRKDWGYGGHVIANCYAYQSPSPDVLKRAGYPTGPDNDAYLLAVATLPLIVVAWGAHVQPERARIVSRLLRTFGASLYCFGVNLDGSPKHPLYLPYDTKLQPFTD